MTETTRTGPNAASRLYFRQLLAGRDFSVGDPVALQMLNFVYLVGDRLTGEALIVDPAYGVDDLLAVLAADDMRCVGVLATHYHPDHVGGDLMGTSIEGIARLLERAAVPVHVQADEAPWVERVTGVGAGELVTHHGGDVVAVGEVPVTLVHTPGHTPGSQCFLVEGRLVFAADLAEQDKLAEAIELLLGAGAARDLRRPGDRHIRQWYLLADLCERAGDIPRARELFARVVVADPEMADAVSRLAALGTVAPTERDRRSVITLGEIADTPRTAPSP